jgi:uncharacterized membrane protein YhaH (DUF805 family)
MFILVLLWALTNFFPSLFAKLGIIVGVWAIVQFWAITSRRLHDCHHSGWLQTLPSTGVCIWFVYNFYADAQKVEAVFKQVTGQSLAHSPFELAFIIWFIGSFVFLAWLATSPGDDGFNEYGESQD